MPDLDIKDAVATREFDLKDGGKAYVNFWKPVYFPDAPEAGTYEYYECRFQITGIGYDKIWRANGVDSLQALMLAIQVASTNIHESEVYKSGHLTYLGGSNPDLSDTIQQKVK